MADEIGRGVIRLSLDGREIAVGMAEVKRKVKDLEATTDTSARKITSAFSGVGTAATGAGNAASAAAKATTNAVNNMANAANDAAGKTNSAFSGMANALTNAGTSAGKTSSAFSAMGVAAQQAGSGAAGAAQAATSTANQLNNAANSTASSVNKTASAFSAMGIAAKQAAQAAGAAGAAAGAATGGGGGAGYGFGGAAGAGYAPPPPPPPQAVQQTTTQAINRYIASVEREIAVTQMSRAEFRQWEGQRRNIPQAVIDPLVQRLDAAKKAMAGFTAAEAQAASEDAFINSLMKRQAALKQTTEDVLRMEAAQLGPRAEARAAPIIQKMETDRQDAGNATFIAQMERQTRVMSMSKSELLEYDAIQRGIGPAVYAPHVAALRMQEKQMEANGLSSRQMAQAMRLLPAQITDIVTSIASGMPIWLVAIQQGGQLKDSFNGLGNAASAVGTYLGKLAGMISPLTLILAGAGAAAVVMLAAFKGGENEMNAFNTAIIMSGNASGKTADQFRDMAARIGSGIGTQGQAADALTQLAATGRISGDVIEGLGRSAVAMEKATGTAIKETVAQFVELGKEPVEASLKLNESYNYLSASILKQISDLENQGRASEAAALAQRTFADAIETRAAGIVQNLGYIETAWRGIKDGIQSAIDKVLEFGRTKTPTQELAEARSELKSLQEAAAKAQEPNAKPRRNRFGAEIAPADDKVLQAGIAAAQARVQGLEKINALQDIEESTVANLNAANQTGVKNMQERLRLDEMALKLDRNKEKAIKMAIDKAKLKAGDNWTEEDARTIRETMDPPKKSTAKPKEYRDNQFERMKLEIQGRNAIVVAQGLELENEEKLGQAASARVKFDSMIAELKEKKILTADQKSVLAGQDILRAMLDIGVEAEKANDRTKKELDLKKEIEAAENRHAARVKEENRLTEQYKEALADEQFVTDRGYRATEQTFGKGDASRKLVEGEIQINDKYSKDARRLEKEQAKGSITEEIYKERLQMLRDHHDEALTSWRDHYANIKALEQDGTLGAQRAVENFMDAGKNQAAQMESLVGTALGSLSQAFVDFATTGEFSFKRLREAILAEMAQIMANRLITAILDMGFKAAFGGGPAAGAGTPTSAMQSVVPAAGGGATMFAAGGIQNVPYDGFQATLHQGERVLTRKQTADADQGGSQQPISVSITMPTQGGAPQMTRMEWERASKDAVRKGVSEARLRGAKL